MFIVLNLVDLYGQRVNNTPWFISVGGGVQHSGIRKEDYVKDNFSPLIVIEAGKFFTPYYAVRLGYKGPYYKFISDNDKHNYSFLYADMVLDIKNCISNRSESIWDIQIYAGGGVLYNQYPILLGQKGVLTYPDGRLLIACNIGISNLFRISKTIKLGLDIAAIGSWGLYQDSFDCIPNTFLRIVYSLPKRDYNNVSLRP